VITTRTVFLIFPNALDDQLGNIPDTKADVGEILNVDDADSPKASAPQKFKDIDRLVKSAAAFASHMNRSCLGQRLFSQFQLGKGIDDPEYCVVYAKTRWTGLYECLKQHTHLVNKCFLIEFLNGYTPEKISGNVVKMMSPKSGDGVSFEILTSTLYPLYLFTKKTEEESISLCQGYIAALELVAELRSESMKVVDRDGYIVEKVVEVAGKSRNIFRSRKVSAIDAENKLFREQLAKSISDRILIRELEDELAVSLFFDPKSRKDLERWLSDDTVGGYAKVLLDRMSGMHNTIEDRMKQFKQTRMDENNDDNMSAESDLVVADDISLEIDPQILDGLSAADRAEVIASLQNKSNDAKPKPSSANERDEFAKLKEALASSSADDTSYESSSLS